MGTPTLWKEVNVTGNPGGNSVKTAKRSSSLTRVIATTHFHVSVVYPEDPSARVAHVGGSLNVHHVSSARAGDVEIALAITGIETCLGRE